MSKAAETDLRELLDDLRGALQSPDSLDPASTPADAGQDDLENLVDIVQALHASMKPQQPRPDFAAGLRADLLNEEPGVVERVRQMPPRVRLAAILAVFAGCGLLMLRRVFGSETAREAPEEAVATPL